MNGHWSLIISAIASLFLLTVIIQIRAKKPDWLDLDTKWLAVSALPILIGLFSGGYITSFKGLGIEIEAALQEPVKDRIKLKATQAKAAESLTSVTSQKKGSISELQQLTPDEKNAIQRLTFKNKYPWYSAVAVKEYLKILPRVRFIEIVDDNLKFLGAIRTQDIKGLESLFTKAVKAGNVKEKFIQIYVTKYIDSDISAIQALKIIKDNKLSFLPMLNSDHTMKGIVTRRSLEHRIAEDVLAASNKSSAK